MSIRILFPLHRKYELVGSNSMKALNYITLLILLTGCHSDYKVTNEFYDNGKPKKVRIYKDKDDKANYTLICYFENGKIKTRATVKDNLFVGEKINYYENGTIQQIDSIINPCVLSNCCCDGKVKRYDSTGKIIEDFENRNGVENGTVHTYYENGVIKDNYKMQNGKKNGVALAYYESGVISFKAVYKNDTLINFVYYFNEKGDTTKYFNTTNGEMDFPYKKWLENGLILYGNYTDTTRKSVLWQWFDKTNKEIKRVIKKEEKAGFVAPE